MVGDVQCPSQSAIDSPPSRLGGGQRRSPGSRASKLQRPVNDCRSVRHGRREGVTPRVKVKGACDFNGEREDASCPGLEEEALPCCSQCSGFLRMYEEAGSLQSQRMPGLRDSVTGLFCDSGWTGLEEQNRKKQMNQQIYAAPGRPTVITVISSSCSFSRRPPPPVGATPGDCRVATHRPGTSIGCQPADYRAPSHCLHCCCHMQP